MAAGGVDTRLEMGPRFESSSDTKQVEGGIRFQTAVFSALHSSVHQGITLGSKPAAPSPPGFPAPLGQRSPEWLPLLVSRRQGLDF